MKIEDSAKLWMSDMLIPVLFVTDFLPCLSPSAVKVYLYAKHVSRCRRELRTAELLGHLGMGEKEFKDALLDLAQHQVINLLGQEDGERFVLNDLKEMELQKQLREAAQPKLSAELSERVRPELGDFAHQIQETYYHGMMGAGQRNLIERCIREYGFDLNVIYALFSESEAAGKLNQIKYIEAIAKAWHEKGIREYAQLKALFKRRDEVKRLARRVGKKLKRTMGEPEEEMIRHWAFDLGFNFQIINLALDRSVRVANPGMNYFNRILEDWHKAGLKEAEEIEAYERAREAKHRARRAVGEKGAAAGYSQRAYSQGEIDALYVQLSPEELRGGEERGDD